LALVEKIEASNEYFAYLDHLAQVDWFVTIIYFIDQSSSKLCSNKYLPMGVGGFLFWWLEGIPVIKHHFSNY